MSKSTNELSFEKLDQKYYDMIEGYYKSVSTPGNSSIEKYRVTNANKTLFITGYNNNTVQFQGKEAKKEISWWKKVLPVRIGLVSNGYLESSINSILDKKKQYKIISEDINAQLRMKLKRFRCFSYFVYVVSLSVIIYTVIANGLGWSEKTINNMVSLYTIIFPFITSNLSKRTEKYRNEIEKKEEGIKLIINEMCLNLDTLTKMTKMYGQVGEEAYKSLLNSISIKKWNRYSSEGAISKDLKLFINELYDIVKLMTLLDYDSEGMEKESSKVMSVLQKEMNEVIDCLNKSVSTKTENISPFFLSDF